MADTLGSSKSTSTMNFGGLILHLSRGFPIGLCLKKVGIAIIGLLLANFLGVLLVAIMAPSAPPPAFRINDKNANWPEYREDLNRWNLWHEVAAVGQNGPGAYLGLGDLARSQEEYAFLVEFLGEEFDPAQPDKVAVAKSKLRSVSEASLLKAKAPTGLDFSRVQVLADQIGSEKPAGRLVSLVWFEDRGPNPILALGQYGEGGLVNRFADLVSKEMSFALEPLRKLILPVYYVAHPQASIGQRIFFLLLLVATLSVWTLAGGVITRIAALEFTRKQTVGIKKAFGFVWDRKENYLLAPWLPAVPGVVLLLGMVIFGFLHLIPWVGDILVSGLGWIIMIGSGLVLALISIGLLGWPLMTIAVSVESDDAFAATTKPYSYFGQRGWLALGTGLFCTIYGAICLIFLCWILSLGVYLAKWGVAQTPGVKSLKRSPEFLFVNAPTTFGWRDLLLSGATTPEGNQVVEGNQVNPVRLSEFKAGLSANQTAGAFLASGWLYLVVLPMIGLGYSLFWSFMTGIYLVLRKAADDVELDDIFLDEEDDPVFAPVQAPAFQPSSGGECGKSPPETTKPGVVSLSVVETKP